MENPQTPNTVLVVEDEPILRELSADELGEAGYLVLEAGTAAEALDIMRSGRTVGILFTDVNMPGAMDGLELARLVSDLWPDVRLIVTSGAGRVRQCDVPDEGRFLAKPYSLSKLRETVDDLAGAPPHA